MNLNEENYMFPREDDDDDDEKELTSQERNELREALEDITFKDDEETESVMESTINPFARPANSGISMSGTPRTSWTAPAPTTPQVNPYQGFNTSPRPQFGSPFTALQQPTTNYGGYQYTGGTSPVGTTNQWYGNPANGQPLDRTKKILFCDLLGVTAECYQVGTAPRGPQDIHPHHAAIEKLRCFTPDYIFIISNQYITTPEQQHEWRCITEFIAASVAKMCMIPFDRCRSFIGPIDTFQNRMMKPNTGLMEESLKQGIGYDWAARYSKQSMLVIGSCSGYRNQSDRDIKMAESFGCDYISIESLLSGC